MGTSAPQTPVNARQNTRLRPIEGAGCLRDALRHVPISAQLLKPRLEHMPIRLSVARVCKVSFAFAFGYRFEKRGDGFPKPLNRARLCFA